MATKCFKAVKKEVEEFKKVLPELLKKAVRKHYGMTLLQKPLAGETREFYILKRGKVEHYLSGYEIKPKPDMKCSYEDFTNNLSYEDAIIVAKNLSELGF